MPRSHEASPHEASPGESVRAGRARILIVEDNALNRLLVHDILELRGHQVIEAATVDEALLILEVERVDLLLLDVNIPGGGGEAVIRGVRQRPALVDLPIVAVTSLAMPGDRERLLASGFQGYLSKPIDTRTFGPAVEAYLRPPVADAPAQADRPETVLVVDDNLQNREVAEGHLVSAGYVAIQADGGESALLLFEERRPDLVLLDVVMPRMDGFETCRRIRALPGGPETPILFLTALGDLGTHKAALDSGADDFLTKPINRTELLLRVRSLLRIKALSEELKQNYDVIRMQRDALLEAQLQKKELATLIVHDLKNPLSSILSNVQFLSGSRDLHDRDRESLVDVLRASRTMFRMVMNLLDISRSEDGALVPRYGSFDVAALLREIASEMIHRLEDKKQKLALAVQGEIGEITADRDLVRRVIENLVDNAYKYSPLESTITIELIGAGATAALPAAIEIRVRDEGEGIPVAYRSRIFDKYVRIDDRGQAELRNSHGLGLVFCRTAVAVHGGEIWVEDNLPRGSCFCLRLAREPAVLTVRDTSREDDDDPEASARDRIASLSAAAAIASPG